MRLCACGLKPSRVKKRSAGQADVRQHFLTEARAAQRSENSRSTNARSCCMPRRFWSRQVSFQASRGEAEADEVTSEETGSISKLTPFAYGPTQFHAAAQATVSVLPLKSILAAISDRTRWRIFDGLIHGEPLPVQVLARTGSGSPPRTSPNIPPPCCASACRSAALAILTASQYDSSPPPANESSTSARSSCTSIARAAAELRQPKHRAGGRKKLTQDGESMRSRISHDPEMPVQFIRRTPWCFQDSIVNPTSTGIHAVG
jgi:hypothetical protein